ncbi:MAG: ABC transporter ATP-binding protein [Coriobacteriia bacterium]|nr:ABC transporter ATP-binding protein [Coriobacteriia bacterium]MBN2847427.1 ABC transporter ATP-binding protein [Coriobacteriia bacterium]
MNTEHTHTAPLRGARTGTDARPLVEVRGVAKVYGSKTVLDDVAMTIRRGEVVGLVGPNGAGKTTLIRILSGMSRPSRGEGTVLDRDIASTAGRLPFLGLMVERPMFIETLSGRRNLELLFGIRGAADGSSAESVLERVGLDPSDRKPVRAYSLGMRQRLSLAQAIGERPRLVVLDEPTNGLDPQGIIEMRSLVRELADRDGMGVLLTSHLLTEVEAVCDRVVLIHGGRAQRVYAPGDAEARGAMLLEVASPEDVGRVASVGVVEVVGSGGPLLMRIRVREAVPDVVRALVGAGVRIEAIHRDGSGLERAYMETVGAR